MNDHLKGEIRFLRKKAVQRLRDIGRMIVCVVRIDTIISMIQPRIRFNYFGKLLFSSCRSILTTTKIERSMISPIGSPMISASVCTA